MKLLKVKLNRMYLNKINKKYLKLSSSSFNLNLTPNKTKKGIIYTLYSDKLNSIEIGFAENNKIIQNKLMRKDLILLDKARGKQGDLNLLIRTLNEMDINSSSKLNFRYSDSLIRHLSTLGWPVGRSLYKQRRIKKEFSFA